MKPADCNNISPALTTIFDSYSVFYPVIGTLTLLLLPSHALAAEWRLKLSLNMAEIYSDNIRMSPRGKEQADLATQISPGLTLTATGPKLTINARYQMQNQLYMKNSGQNSIRHQLNADAHTELLANRLFLDGAASVSQQNTSILGPQALTNVNITANRADVMTLTLSPYLEHRFGNQATGEVRYTHSELNTSAAGLANNQTDRLMLKLDSGTSFNALAWNVNYSTQQARYSNYLQAINNETYTGTLIYRITPRFALNAVGGFEKSNYIALGAPPSGAIYSMGFSWAPSPRTTIEASTGHRYFGNNSALNINHRTRRTHWQLSYSEDITTTQAQFLANTNTPPQLPPGAVNLLSNQVFLQKRLQSTVTLNGLRNTFTFTLFNTARDAQTSQTQNLALFGPANLSLGNNSKQLGGNAYWSSKISPHTTSNLTLGYTANDFPAVGVTSYDKNLQVGFTTQLDSKLNGHINLRHSQRNSNLANSDYQENSLNASLLMQF